MVRQTTKSRPRSSRVKRLSIIPEIDHLKSPESRSFLTLQENDLNAQISVRSKLFEPTAASITNQYANCPGKCSTASIAKRRINSQSKGTIGLYSSENSRNRVSTSTTTYTVLLSRLFKPTQSSIAKTKSKVENRHDATHIMRSQRAARLYAHVDSKLYEPTYSTIAGRHGSIQPILEVNKKSSRKQTAGPVKKKNKRVVKKEIGTSPQSLLKAGTTRSCQLYKASIENRKTKSDLSPSKSGTKFSHVPSKLYESTFSSSNGRHIVCDSSSDSSVKICDLGVSKSSQNFAHVRSKLYEPTFSTKKSRYVARQSLSERSSLTSPPNIHSKGTIGLYSSENSRNRVSTSTTTYTVLLSRLLKPTQSSIAKSKPKVENRHDATQVISRRSKLKITSSKTTEQSKPMDVMNQTDTFNINNNLHRTIEPPRDCEQFEYTLTSFLNTIDHTLESSADCSEELQASDGVTHPSDTSYSNIIKKLPMDDAELYPMVEKMVKYSVADMLSNGGYVLNLLDCKTATKNCNSNENYIIYEDTQDDSVPSKQNDDCAPFNQNNDPVTLNQNDGSMKNCNSNEDSITYKDTQDDSVPSKLTDDFVPFNKNDDPVTLKQNDDSFPLNKKDQDCGSVDLNQCADSVGFTQDVNSAAKNQYYDSADLSQDDSSTHLSQDDDLSYSNQDGDLTYSNRDDDSAHSSLDDDTVGLNRYDDLACLNLNDDHRLHQNNKLMRLKQRHLISINQDDSLGKYLNDSLSNYDRLELIIPIDYLPILEEVNEFGSSAEFYPRSEESKIDPSVEICFKSSSSALNKSSIRRNTEGNTDITDEALSNLLTDNSCSQVHNAEGHTQAKRNDSCDGSPIFEYYAAFFKNTSCICCPKRSHSEVSVKNNYCEDIELVYKPGDYCHGETNQDIIARDAANKGESFSIDMDASTTERKSPTSFSTSREVENNCRKTSQINASVCTGIELQIMDSSNDRIKFIAIDGSPIFSKSVIPSAITITRQKDWGDDKTTRTIDRMLGGGSDELMNMEIHISTTSEGPKAIGMSYSMVP